ncbi:MAG: hypothetical protein RR449_08410, partial [Christensenella sp.]
SGSPLHPDDAPALFEMFDKLFAGEKTAKSVGRWGNGDDSVWWWYEIAYTTIFDDEGKPLRAIGTAIDITERVRLEERYDEEIKWRKVHNKDVMGSFKMNLTQNTCEDGQSDVATILSFHGDGTVDGFFEREYATHMYPEELKKYKKIFNRKNLLRGYREGKTSFTEEAYVDFGENKMLWIMIELDMFQNPKNGDVEAYIYAMDIDQKKTARALVDSVVNMDYDFLVLLDAAADKYTLFAKTNGNITLPQFYSSDYETEVAQFARESLVEEDVEQNIHDMSYENLFEQLETKSVFTTYFRVKEADGGISSKKIQFSYLDKPRKKIIVAQTDITEIYNE